MIRQYGGDFDEAMSDANIAFLDAFDSYNGSSAFTTWVRTRVWYALITSARKKAEERGRRTRNLADEKVRGIPCSSGVGEDGASMFDVPDRSRCSRLREVIEELGEDARIVVQLVVETPAELEQVWEAKGGQPRNLRTSIRQYLADAGWTAARIAESFFEIRRVLAG